MTLSIISDDIGEIPLTFIENFSFKINMNSLLSSCHITYIDFGKQFFNYIKTGMGVNIVFSDKENNVTYVNRMAILDFNKVPGGSIMSEKLEIDLIPSIYFEDSVATSCYKGTVKEIVNNIIESKFDKYSNSKYLINTNDPTRIRYQIGERYLSFIERILKFGNINNLPVYCYTDARGILNLRGISEFIDSTPKYVLANDEVLLGNKIPDSKKTLNVIRVLDYRINTDISKSSSITEARIATELYVPYEIKTEKQVTLTNNEIGNEQVSNTTPPSVVYTPWYRSPSDAKAIITKDIFENNIYSYTLVGVSEGLLFDGFQIGDKVSVVLPYEPIKKSSSNGDCNLGEGNYIVKGVEYTFKENMGYTKYLLVLIDY